MDSQSPCKSRCANSHRNPSVPPMGEKVQRGECPKPAALEAPKTERPSQRRWNERTDSHVHTHKCEHTQTKHTHMHSETHMHKETHIHRDSQTDSHEDTHAHTCAHIDRHTYTCTHIYRHTCAHPDTHTLKHVLRNYGLGRWLSGSRCLLTGLKPCDSQNPHGAKTELISQICLLTSTCYAMHVPYTQTTLTNKSE